MLRSGLRSGVQSGVRAALMAVVVLLATVAGSFVAVSVLAPAPARADTGPWAWPLEAVHRVSRPFDPPQVRYAAGHRGADLPASSGDPVLAAGAGLVSYAGLLAGRGVVVVVHGALRTTYEPVTAAVAVGEQVEAGSLLGALEPGHDGCPVEACLHWGLRRGETYLDPVRLVQPGPVRLLPVSGGGGGETGGLRDGPLASPLAGSDGGPPTPAPAGGDASTGVAPVDREGHGRGELDHAARGQPDPDPALGSADEGRSVRLAGTQHRTPLEMVAVAALVGGVALLARPRPAPPLRPAPPPRQAGTAPAQQVTPAPPRRAPPTAGGTVSELDAERLRRRPA